MKKVKENVIFAVYLIFIFILLYMSYYILFNA